MEIPYRIVTWTDHWTHEEDEDDWDLLDFINNDKGLLSRLGEIITIS